MERWLSIPVEYLGSLTVFMLAMSIIAFLLFLVDKRSAIRHGRRIPERELLGAVWFLGGVGGLLAMLLLHHKTGKHRFRVQVPVAALLQSLLLVFAWFG